MGSFVLTEGPVWWAVKTPLAWKALPYISFRKTMSEEHEVCDLFGDTSPNSLTYIYYMALSYKDWELPNSRIGSAEIDIESGLQSWTKVLTQLSKTNAFYRRPSIISKTSFLSIAKPLSPPFQCWNTRWRYCHVVTTLKRGEGVECENWRLKKSRGQWTKLFGGECLNCFCPWL